MTGGEGLFGGFGSARGYLRSGSASPYELAVFVTFRWDTDEAGLSIEYPSDVLWGDARVEPGGGYSDAHLVLCAVSCTAMEADCPSCGAAGYLV